MAPKTVEAGNRALRGADLGVEKACVVAAFNPEYILSVHAVQARILAARYGLTLERARLTAELAFARRAR